MVIRACGLTLASLLLSSMAGCEEMPQSVSASEGRDLESCFRKYYDSVRKDRSTATQYFAKSYLSEELNDLLQTSPEDFPHNRHAVEKFLYIPERITKINSLSTSCDVDGCGVRVKYSNDSGGNSDVTFLYESPQSGACPSIRAIQVTFQNA